jgi:hypothetical protein|nr:MAG TPA: hypothetical protein [Caudoviricetes sp.]
MLERLIKFIKYKIFKIQSPSRIWYEAYAPLFESIAKEFKEPKLSGSFIFRKENQTNEQMEEEAREKIKECELLGWKLIDFERYIYEDTEIIGLIILVFEKK